MDPQETACNWAHSCHGATRLLCSALIVNKAAVRDVFLSDPLDSVVGIIASNFDLFNPVNLTHQAFLIIIEELNKTKFRDGKDTSEGARTDL
jgi:hypothetical protein